MNSLTVKLLKSHLFDVKGVRWVRRFTPAELINDSDPHVNKQSTVSNERSPFLYVFFLNVK